jgi:hypothetical protein
MVRVEVFLPEECTFEIFNVPSIPNMAWTDANILALQIVFDRLKQRAIEDGSSLKGLEMSARNPEWSHTWNEDIEHWL